ncbi:hypothetical protein BSP239C_03159 [Brevibacterium sp. 239c]|uniref:hypothetical protein n=1 Tax=Brevibacterium sp. 239c TaxID=1965356 RepID=UPI000C3C7BA5|nr:hypothetical protein [Brevibacterium sp. 239c]SMY00939.1 hypothetical protein BSP239C_03159 [Brevibacterium sp. 239c]
MNCTGRHSARFLTQSSALAVAAVLALSACGTDDSAADEAPSDAAPGQGQEEALEAGEEAEQTPEETAESDSAEGASDKAEGAEVKVGAEFTDKETGDVVTVVSAVRDNPTEYYEATDNPDGEMVYIEVKVVPGKSYGGTISAADFYLDSAGEEANYASSAKDELEEAGYEYFDRAPRRDGDHTGYIPIYVSETADELKGSYIRPEAKVLGEDKKIPEFTSEFGVPAS